MKISVRKVIEKLRHIYIYYKKKEEDDHNHHDNERLKNNDTLKGRAQRYITDPFLSVTISERAEKLRTIVKKMKRELRALDENETLQRKTKP